MAKKQETEIVYVKDPVTGDEKWYTRTPGKPDVLIGCIRQVSKANTSPPPHDPKLAQFAQDIDAEAINERLVAFHSILKEQAESFPPDATSLMAIGVFLVGHFKSLGWDEAQVKRLTSAFFSIASEGEPPPKMH